MEQADLRGQVALVTGASRGLGRDVAMELAARGVRLAVTARSAPELDALAREIRHAGGDAMSIAIDVGNWKYVERGVGVVRGHFGAIDILVNAAGTGWSKPFEEWTIDEIDLVVDVNLKGTIYMTRAVLGGMLEAGRGQIVNLAFDSGRHPVAGMAPWAASRSGVIGFARSLQREVRARGIRVTTVIPGSPCDGSPLTGPIARTIVDLLELPRQSGVDEIAIAGPEG